jgi:hypothetical protein
MSFKFRRAISEGVFLEGVPNIMYNKKARQPIRTGISFVFPTYMYYFINSNSSYPLTHYIGII